MTGILTHKERWTITPEAEDVNQINPIPGQAPLKTGDSNNQKQKGDPQFPNYNPNQLPPSLDIAIIYRKRCGIGKMGVKDPWNNLIVDNYDFFKTPGQKVTAHGPTIPLYFQFSKYMFYLFVIFALTKIYLIVRNYQLQCKYTKLKNEEDSCQMGWYLFERAVVRTNQLFIKEMFDMRQFDALLSLCSAFPITLFIVYYQFRQRRLIKELASGKKKKKSGRIQDFAVMIGNVKQDDDEEDIIDFIQNKIEGDVRVDSCGVINVEFLSSQIFLEQKRDIGYQIDSVVKKLRKFEEDNKELMNLRQLKEMDKFLRREERKVRRFKKKELRYKNRWWNFSNFGRSAEQNLCIVTFESSLHKEVFFSKRRRIVCCKNRVLTVFSLLFERKKLRRKKTMFEKKKEGVYRNGLYEMSQSINEDQMVVEQRKLKQRRYRIMETPSLGDLNFYGIGFTWLSRALMRVVELFVLLCLQMVLFSLFFLFMINYHFFDFRGFLSGQGGSTTADDPDNLKERYKTLVEIALAILFFTIEVFLKDMLNSLSGYHRYLLKQYKMVVEAQRVQMISLLSISIFFIFLFHLINLDNQVHFLTRIDTKDTTNTIFHIIFYYLAIKVLVLPLFLFLHPKQLYKDYRRMRATKALKQKGKISKFHWIPQRKLNKIFEKVDPIIHDKFTKMMSVTLSILLVAYFMPIMCLLAPFYILLQSQMDKYLLYKKSKMPTKNTEIFAQKMVSLMYLIPKALVVLALTDYFYEDCFFTDKNKALKISLYLFFCVFVTLAAPLDQFFGTLIDFFEDIEDRRSGRARRQIKYFEDHEEQILAEFTIKDRGKMSYITTKLKGGGRSTNAANNN